MCPQAHLSFRENQARQRRIACAACLSGMSFFMIISGSPGKSNAFSQIVVNYLSIYLDNRPALPYDEGKTRRHLAAGK